MLKYPYPFILYKVQSAIPYIHGRSETSELCAHYNPTPEQITDEVLAAQVARGNSAALEALYERYAPIVLSISLRVTGNQAEAEDVLQETFWRLWRRASTFQSPRGSFTGWLFRIVHNLAIDAYRRRNARPRVFSEANDADTILDQMPDPNIDVVEQTQLSLKNQQVLKALESLPPTQRQVIEMAYFYGMTRHEIAEATGEALGTIHTRARLGLQKLHDQLENEEFER